MLSCQEREKEILSPRALLKEQSCYETQKEREREETLEEEDTGDGLESFSSQRPKVKHTLSHPLFALPKKKLHPRRKISETDIANFTYYTSMKV